MERLTERLDGWIMRKGCHGPCRTCNGADCADIYSMIDRLAAYEDTGLSPEEVMELARAEKDGRMVVLPCKQGDTLWTYCWRYCSRPSPEACSFKVTGVSTLDGKTVLNTDIFQVISATEVGETVFLTRAEAEAALETKGKEDG